MTHPGVVYSAGEDVMLVAEEAVEMPGLEAAGQEHSRDSADAQLVAQRGKGLPHYEREAQPSKLGPYKHSIDERVKAAAFSSRSKHRRRNPVRRSAMAAGTAS